MYVLYVGRDRENPEEYCPGSLVCMTLAEKLFDIEITIQDCSILRVSKALPDWLNGTPILVDRRDPTPLRGTDAVRALQSILRAQERQSDSRRDDDDEENDASRRPSAKAQGAIPRMQGQMTRQPSEKRTPRSAAPPQQRQPPPSDYVETPDAYTPEDDGEMMDATANGIAGNAGISDGKVTDQDLQKYMEARNASAASQASPPPMNMSQ